MADSRPEVLVRNQVDGVLQDYLDQLLVVATETRTSGPAPVTSPVTAPVTLATAMEPLTQNLVLQSEPEAELLLVDGEIQGWDIDDVQEPVVASVETLTPTVIPDSSADTAVEAVETPAAISADMPSDSPALRASATAGLNWDSRQGIECLIFKVAGLKLAIPLPFLGGVFPVEGKVTPLIGQVKWSLGVWQCDGQKLTVIDSAQLIMPERGVSLKDEGYEYLIQLDRAPWALACQEICDTVTLVNESIKWRGDLSKRPWLAGTVISEMCALLDVPGLIDLAESQRKAS